MATTLPAPPIERACFWLARQPAEAGEALAGEQQADIVIVGAGLTGLWSAIHLLTLEPGLKVAVVEAERVGYGASGRNAGILSDTIDHSHALAIDHFGIDEARRLAALGRSNLTELIGFLQARGIDCDLERSGILTTALSPEQRIGLEASLKSARELGVDDWRLLSAEETRAEIHSDLYQGALFNPAGGVLDPVSLINGLAREARRLGARIFEQSAVLSLERAGSGMRLRTAGGTLRAKRCVLGMSAYTHLLVPRAKHRFLPLFDYVLVSENLTAAQRETIGWHKRQGVSDARSFFNYYRLTDDDRILWGTSEAAYYPPNRVDRGCDHSAQHYAELKTSFIEHFPALRELEFPWAWGGAICATTRFSPFFGRALGGRVLYGLGFTGHGLGTTHLAGKILAHLALRRDSELLNLKLVRELPFPYPPEPIRRWAVGQVSRALRRVDRGEPPNLLLRCLDALGIGLSS